MVNRRDRVLLVDDQPTNVRVLAEALGDAYELAFATSGERALELAPGSDLILLDVVMPGLSGFAVCEKLKANPATAAIPVIFVTALGETDDETHGFDVGGIDYITKPISPATVRARVRTHLAMKKQKDIIEQVERMSRHDLKTPLNSVISFASLIADDQRSSEPSRDMAVKIERAGYRILEMINRSLDLFKLEQGTYVVHASAIDVFAIAARAADELQNEDVRCEVRGSGVARGEELLTYSILANLIKNAVEASPANEPVIIDIEQQDDVVIRIRNRGAVPHEIRDHFFDKYATAGKRGGTGLGTYSARLMAEAQQGSIALTANDDETIVTVRLPLTRPSATLSPLSRGEGQIWPSPRVRGEGARSADEGLRLLVVDDDEWSRLAIKKMLAQPGWTIDEAPNGAAAIQKCNQQGYDYVFIDLEMPVMSGLEAMPRLRAAAVVAMSAHDDDATRMNALAAGARIYLTKPATREALYNVIGAPVVRLDSDIAELIPGFLHGKREEIARMNGAPAERIVETSHRLKGSFRLYGFEEAARLCGEIEHHALGARLNEVPELLSALITHLERMRVEYA